MTDHQNSSADIEHELWHQATSRLQEITDNDARGRYGRLAREALEHLETLRFLGPAEAMPMPDIRWAVNVLLEQIADGFEKWETADVWRSDAAAYVRARKHDLGTQFVAPAQPTVGSIYDAVYRANGSTLNNGGAVRKAIACALASQPSPAATVDTDGGHDELLDIEEGFDAGEWNNVPVQRLSAGTDDLVTRLGQHVDGDHKRGCMGRQYSCSCGYDEATEKLLTEALNAVGAQAMRLDACDAEISRLRDAPQEVAESPEVLADRVIADRQVIWLRECGFQSSARFESELRAAVIRACSVTRPESK